MSPEFDIPILCVERKGLIQMRSAFSHYSGSENFEAGVQVDSSHRGHVVVMSDTGFFELQCNFGKRSSTLNPISRFVT